jgi:hypothetical protein
MRRRWIRFTGPCALVLLAGALLNPGPAAAEPGSALDQYTENVPGATRDHPSSGLGADDPGPPLPPAAAEALADLGTAGERAAVLAEAGGTRGDAGADRAVDPGDGTGATAVIGDLLDPSSRGMGFILPLILVGALIAGVLHTLRVRAGRIPTE